MFWLGWLAKEFLGSICLHFPTPALQLAGLADMLGFYVGSEIRASCLQGKYFYLVSHHPSPNSRPVSKVETIICRWSFNF